MQNSEGIRLTIIRQPSRVDGHTCWKIEQKCKGDHEHEFVNRRFESREAVKEYLKDNELETQFIIRATGKGNVYYEVR